MINWNKLRCEKCMFGSTKHPSGTAPLNNRKYIIELELNNKIIICIHNRTQYSAMNWHEFHYLFTSQSTTRKG